MRASHFFTYPLTGAQPVEQGGAVVESAGFINDRPLVAYDPTKLAGEGEVDGTPVHPRVSQALVRQLAQITPVLGLHSIELRHDIAGRVEIPLDTQEGRMVYVDEFGDATPVFDVGDAAAALLQEATGRKSLRIGEKTPEWRAGGLIAPSLRRNAPIHIISAASLRVLENMLGEPIDPRRFRPNAIVDGPDLQPFAETGWIGQVVRIGNHDRGVAVEIDGVTKRCNVPGNDVLTGQNRRDVPRIYNQIPGAKPGEVATFGVYAHPVRLGDMQKTITRNDQVELFKTNISTAIITAV